MSQSIEQESRQSVAVGGHRLEGLLLLPSEPKGIVIFAHGSGSSRFSPRNAFVARELSKRGHATLLFDLLTEEEARQKTNVFDICLLAGRVVEAIDAVRANATTRDLAVGLFGASTGAAAALVAATQRPESVCAVVSRGGRPDLASGALRNVRAPTMLIVGSRDTAVLELNRSALEEMTCVRCLHVVRGATHLFEEAGALGDVVEAAAFWFRVHLIGSDVERWVGR